MIPVEPRFGSPFGSRFGSTLFIGHWKVTLANEDGMNFAQIWDGLDCFVTLYRLRVKANIRLNVISSSKA